MREALEFAHGGARPLLWSALALALAAAEGGAAVLADDALLGLAVADLEVS